MELLFNPHPDYTRLSPTFHLSRLTFKVHSVRLAFVSSLSRIMICFIHMHEFIIHACREELHISTQSSKFSFVFLRDAKSATNCDFPLIDSVPSFSSSVRSSPPVVIVYLLVQASEWIRPPLQRRLSQRFANAIRFSKWKSSS